jgi:branched-chain amino acid transport system substrate-binding protein
VLVALGVLSACASRVADEVAAEAAASVVTVASPIAPSVDDGAVTADTVPSAAPVADSGASAPAAAVGGAAQGPAAAPTATPAAQGCTKQLAPVNIGTFGTTTGPLGALFSAMTPAAQAWTASINARGGLNCHPVKLIVGEDGDDPARARAVVQKMVEEQHVIAFVAHHGALTLGAVRPYLEAKRIPLFGSSGAYADESESEMVFLAQPTSVVGESEAYINTVLALGLPQRKIAVFWCLEVPLCAVHNQVIQRQAAAKGFQVVASIRISLFSPDYTAEILQARNAGADMSVLLSDMQTNGRLLRGMNRQGYKPLFVTPGVPYDSQWPGIIGRDADGIIMTGWSRPWHTGAYLADYRAAVAKYQPNAATGNSGAAAWTALKLLEAAARNLDPDRPSADQLIEGVYKLKDETLGGLIPPTTWPRDGSKRAGLHPCTVPIRWTGTKFELPLGEKFVCSAPGATVKVLP